MMMRLLVAIIVAITSGVAAWPAFSETVIAALSEKRVDIRSNFVGTDLVVFGSIERDAATVGRAHGYDIVIVVEGPDRDVVVWRKERVAGIWVNGAHAEFKNAPSYFAVLSNRPLSDISGSPTLDRVDVGLDFLNLANPGEAQVPEASQPFREALIRRRQEARLYFEEPGAVELLTPRTFMAHIPLPANIRTGGYRARVHVFGDGALLATSRLGFWVIKSGFEAAVYNLAHQRPWIYGLLTVAMAVGVGWLGSVLFRRD